MTILLTLLGIWLGEPHAVVSAEEIKRVVGEFVQREFQGSRESAVVEFRSAVAAVPITGESHTLRVVSQTSGILRGNVSVPVEVLVKGSAVRTVVLSLKVRTFGEVLITTKQLSRYAVLGMDDVVARSVETTSLPEDVIHALMELSGKRTVRIIASGSILCGSMVEPLPLVRSGERVVLLAKIGSVEVSTQALAKEDGNKGETIVVQKLDSRQQLRAKVVRGNVVELDIH